LLVIITLSVIDVLYVLDESCTVNLKVSPSKEAPISVQDHDVPVFISDKPKVSDLHWDLTTQQVIKIV